MRNIIIDWIELLNDAEADVRSGSKGICVGRNIPFAAE